jgi:hypothetical protein
VPLNKTLQSSGLESSGLADLQYIFPLTYYDPKKQSCLGKCFKNINTLHKCKVMLLSLSFAVVFLAWALVRKCFRMSASITLPSSFTVTEEPFTMKLFQTR